MRAQCLWWKLFVDGSSNEKGSGAKILESPNKVILEQSLWFEFETTNNQVEYKVLIVGLRLVEEVGAKHLKSLSDSKLVTSQLNEDYQTKNP